jgi:hypothetical protein
VASRVHKAASVKHKARPEAKQDVITLKDLAPRHRVMGGSDRRVFGANAGTHAAEGKDHGRHKESREGSSTQDSKHQGRSRR